MAFLEAAEIILPDPLIDLQRQISGSERAVYAARKRLVLVIPEREMGNGTSPHPLYDRLKVILGDSLRAIELNTAQWIAGDRRLPLVTASDVSVRKVPVPTRFWTIPKEVEILNREFESYSSLESLYKSPFKWVP